MRHLIVGDIHGRYRQLQEALTLASYDESHDHLIGLGDYIDRGRDSKQVMDFLCDLWKRGKATLLQGNHEYAARSVATGIAAVPAELTNTYDFVTTIRSYGHDPARFSYANKWVFFDGLPHTGGEWLTEVLGEEHLQLMVNMPATMIVKNICEGVDLVCCHAGLVTGKTLQEMLAMRDPWLFMWGDQSWTELQDEADLGLPRGMICVYGHFHHRAAPSIRRQRIGIGMEMDVAIYCPEEELIWVSDGDVYHVDPELFYPGGQP